METLKNKPVLVTVSTVVAVIIFIITSTYYGTSRIKDIESRLRHLDGKTDLYTERYEKVIDEQQRAAELNAEIKATLHAIETSLIEIKEDIRVNRTN